MTANSKRFTAPQGRFLRELLDAEGQWSGMWTCRTHRKTTARELEAAGFIAPICLQVLDDDGFAVVPERYRFGWRLTEDAGVLAVFEEFPDDFAWVTKGSVMDPDKRARWLAIVYPPKPVICSAHGRAEPCAEPVDVYCYGAYRSRGETCHIKVHWRPGSGPGHREIFCTKHGRQPWPPELPRTCPSPELIR